MPRCVTASSYHPLMSLSCNNVRKKYATTFHANLDSSHFIRRSHSSLLTISAKTTKSLVLIFAPKNQIMTEAYKKRSLIFAASCATVLIAVAIGVVEAKKRVRNEFIVKKAFSSKFQHRSAYCLHMNPGGGLDDTATLRYHRETRRCYRIGERGPCGKMMIFTIEDANFGICDCDQSLRCGRPLIYWPPKDRCYYAYDQGPCREGKWLVFGFDLHPVCRRNPCITQEESWPSNQKRYWFTFKGQCYRTYTKGYCHHDNEILFNRRTHFRPTCVTETDCSQVPEGGRVQTLSCLPGQRLDFFGKCEREFKPLKQMENTTGLGIRVTPRPPNLYCLFCNL